MEDIFRIYQVCLDPRIASKITDEDGEVSKDDFIKIAQDYKLLDFGSILSGETVKQGFVKDKARNTRSTSQLQSKKVSIFIHILCKISYA